MRTRIGRVLLSAMLALSIETAAQAADNRIVNVNLFAQQDLRAMAMGNAFGAVARGEGALFYNPAGLAQYDLDLKAEVSAGLQGKSLEFAEDTAALSGSSVASGDPNTSKYLKKYAGTTQRYNAQLTQSAVANLGYLNFGIGAAYLDSYRYTIDFTGMSADGLLATDDALLNDIITASEDRLRLTTAGAAFKLGKGKVLLGVAAKSFRYSENSITLAPTVQDIVNNNVEFKFAGGNYPEVSAYDLGMLYRLEFWSALKPQWSLTAFNVGGVTLKRSGADTLDVPASYNLGFAFGPDTGFLHWLVSFEVEDVTDALKVTDRGTGINATLPCMDPTATRTTTCVNQPRTLMQRSHVGFEIGAIRTPTGNNLISLRAGNNKGYATYGAELNLWLVRLLYARGSDNLGWQDKNDEFEFTAFQAGIALAW